MVLASSKLIQNVKKTNYFLWFHRVWDNLIGFNIKILKHVLNIDTEIVINYLIFLEILQKP